MSDAMLLSMCFGAGLFSGFIVGGGLILLVVWRYPRYKAFFWDGPAVPGSYWASVNLLSFFLIPGSVVFLGGTEITLVGCFAVGVVIVGGPFFRRVQREF